MSNLTRYKFHLDMNVECDCTMEVCEGGEFVKFDDAMELSKTVVQQLKAEIRSMVGILNATKNSGHPEDTEWCVNRLRELSAV
ncbi:MAG: hypothetical protein LLG05_03430 [Porphyromonadaceae bacterium]|nr:hypothetical protein [Porphyromonadaceae bacterium]